MVLFENPHFATVTHDLFKVDQSASADIHLLVVAENERISAHKIILANASPVFAAMFYGDLKVEGDEIKIDNSSKAAVTEFLRCIYTHRLDLTVENIADVMGLANMYDVCECFNFCKQFLNEHLPVDRVFLGFKLAVLFEQNELKKKFGEIIGEQPKAVLESNDFVECSQYVLQSLLQMESLICDPEEVFNAVMKWAKNACEEKKLDSSINANRRQVLGDCLYLIPFRQMSNEQIVDCMKECKGLFNQEELEDLIVITHLDEETAMAKSKFGATVSAEYDSTVWTCGYTDVAESQKYWLEKTEISKYTANKCRLLSAIELLEIRHNQLTANASGGIPFKTLSGIVSIIKGKENENEIMLKQHIAIKSSAFCSSRKLIKLIKPIAIEKDEKFEIRFDFDSSWEEQTFYALIPQPNENGNTGLILRRFFCYSK